MWLWNWVTGRSWKNFESFDRNYLEGTVDTDTEIKGDFSIGSE